MQREGLALALGQHDYHLEGLARPPMGQHVGLGVWLAGRLQPREAAIGAIESLCLTDRDRGQPLKRLAPFGLAAQELQPGKRAGVVDVA